ncbi:MAG: universal stress protein [Cyanobacteria bacterium QH_8_48_120]|nr:MAG: universal stress protein [Cyanobacteria bacterium QH_8_48_120]
MLKTILLADSGMGHSEEMLKYLMELPSIRRAEIAILHVVPPQITTDAVTAKWEEGSKIVANAIQRLNLDPNQVSTILRQGEPKDTVGQVADEIDADLIIMGSRGLGRLEAILENSVSQYVFQLSNRPLLVVKDNIYVTTLKRIMVAMDRSDAAQYCLDLALFLLRDLRSTQLVLVHIDLNLQPESGSITTSEAEKDPVLAPAVAKAKKQGIAYRCVATGGNPAKTICHLSQQEKIDLLMLGSPERRPSVAKSLPDLDRLLGSSLSDYVRIHADCPVLLGRNLA